MNGYYNQGRQLNHLIHKGLQSKDYYLILMILVLDFPYFEYFLKIKALHSQFLVLLTLLLPSDSIGFSGVVTSVLVLMGADNFDHTILFASGISIPCKLKHITQSIIIISIIIRYLQIL